MYEVKKNSSGNSLFGINGPILNNNFMYELDCVLTKSELLKTNIINDIGKT